MYANGLHAFCIPLKTKTAEEVVQAYIDNIYSKFRRINENIE